MKLLTYRCDNTVSCGLLTERGIVDIPSSWQGGPPPASIQEILDRGAACLARVRELAQSARETVPLDAVKLLAPIPRPGKVLALAGNYSEHIKEAALKRGFQLGLSESPRQTTVPRPFLMPATAVIGTGDTVPWPAYSKEIDYELELAVVIGERARNKSIYYSSTAKSFTKFSHRFFSVSSNGRYNNFITPFFNIFAKKFCGNFYTLFCLGKINYI